MSGEWSFGSQINEGDRAPPPLELTPPQTIVGARGPYRLLSLIGSGGAGRVYRALDPFGREVALKLLVRADDPQYVERFVREGRMAASVQHPNVITVHEIASHEGHPFLVYELIEEEQSFAEALREYDLDDRLDLLAQVIDGVAAAHRLGLIHRDLKTDNILLGRDGCPRVTDFGLGLREQDQRLTQTGAMIGTPRVMAPEQLRSEREQQGPATDVWSLGVLLYQALTGASPFGGQTLAELVVQVSKTAPTPPRQHNPTVSPELERVCLRALEKRPEDRYSDAGELGRALIAARNGPTRRRLLPALLTGGLVALAVGLGAAIALWKPATGPAPTPAPTKTPARDLLAEELAELDRVYKAKRYNRSLQLIRGTLTRFPDSLEANLNEGEILCQLERYEEAIKCFDRARRLDPDNVRALTASGACKGRLGRYDEGLAELDRAIEIDPRHADALEKRSLVNYERQAYREALDDAERALAIEPDSAEGLNFRGLARGALGDTRGAIKDFRASWEKGKDPHVLANIGTLRIEIGEREEGLADLRKSLELRPEQVAAWVSLGVDHIQQREYAKALESFERGLRVSPDDPWARFGRAAALHRLKRYAEAKAEAEWVITKYPKHPHAEQARRMLRSLREREQRERKKRD